MRATRAVGSTLMFKEIVVLSGPRLSGDSILLVSANFRTRDWGVTLCLGLGWAGSGPGLGWAWAALGWLVLGRAELGWAGCLVDAQWIAQCMRSDSSVDCSVDAQWFPRDPDQPL